MVVLILAVSVHVIHSQDFRRDDLTAILDQIALLPPEDSTGIRNKLNDAISLAKGYEQKAEVLLKVGEYLVDNYAFELADKILMECLNLTLNDSILARVHFQLGLSFMFRDISAVSLQHFHSALKYYQNIGDSLGIGMSLDRIADNHNYLGQHEVARPYYNQCIQIFTSIHDTSRLTNIYNNIGGMMDDDGALDSAIWFYNLSRGWR